MRTQCSKCGAAGPFYASQNHASYCIPCYQATARARYAKQRAAILAAAKALRFRRILALPRAARTRRQQKQVLDSQAPPGKKVCAFCWLAKFPGHFATDKNRDRRDSYCRACRHMLDTQRHQARRKKQA